MTLRQLCNYTYAVRVAGCQDEDELEEFHADLEAPLTRKGRAVEEALRELTGSG